MDSRNENQSDARIRDERSWEDLRSGMEDSRPVGTPIDSGAKLLKPENSSREEMEMYPFRELIGYYLIIIVSFH